MRLLLYNIRYATGTGSGFHMPLPFFGYLRSTTKNLRRIATFIQSCQPDIVGLVEVDSGSYRSQKDNQAAMIARELGHDYIYQSKYRVNSLAHRLPLLAKQGNAFLTRHDITGRRCHYVQNGVKRLVLELELAECRLFLVHLSLHYRHRQYQLNDLHNMFRHSTKPVIVAGDFNVLWGDRELELFLAASGLKNANRTGRPSYPSRAPNRQLDFILHSPEIAVTGFQMPAIQLSDHIPLVCDFEVS